MDVPTPSKVRPYRSTLAAFAGMTISVGLYLLSTLPQWAPLGQMLTMDVSAFADPVREVNRLRFTSIYDSLLSLPPIICIGTFYIVWFERTSRNARALGVEHLRHSPHAWLWLFIPLYGVWVAYESVQELWMSTSRGIDDLKAKPPFLSAWWACFILSVLFDVFGHSSLDSLITHGSKVGVVCLIVGRALSVMSACFMWLTIRDLHCEQTLQARGR